MPVRKKINQLPGANIAGQLDPSQMLVGVDNLETGQSEKVPLTELPKLIQDYTREVFPLSNGHVSVSLTAEPVDIDSVVVFHQGLNIPLFRDSGWTLSGTTLTLDTSIQAVTQTGDNLHVTYVSSV